MSLPIKSCQLSQQKCISDDRGLDMRHLSATVLKRQALTMKAWPMPLACAKHVPRTCECLSLWLQPTCPSGLNIGTRIKSVWAHTLQGAMRSRLHGSSVSRPPTAPLPTLEGHDATPGNLMRDANIQPRQEDKHRQGIPIPLACTDSRSKGPYSVFSGLGTCRTAPNRLQEGDGLTSCTSAPHYHRGA